MADKILQLGQASKRGPYGPLESASLYFKGVPGHGTWQVGVWRLPGSWLSIARWPPTGKRPCLFQSTSCTARSLIIHVPRSLRPRARWYQKIKGSRVGAIESLEDAGNTTRLFRGAAGALGHEVPEGGVGFGLQGVRSRKMHGGARRTVRGGLWPGRSEPAPRSGPQRSEISGDSRGPERSRRWHRWSRRP